MIKVSMQIHAHVSKVAVQSIDRTLRFRTVVDALMFKLVPWAQSYVSNRW